MVTSTQINNCTDPTALFLALTGANGDRPMQSGEHWGEPILAADPQPMFPPWDRWMHWFWYFWYTEIEPTWRYRICGTGAEVSDDFVSMNMGKAADQLGVVLSISRNQGESDVDYAQRLLCAKLQGEQQ